MTSARVRLLLLLLLGLFAAAMFDDSDCICDSMSWLVAEVPPVTVVRVLVSMVFMGENSLLGPIKSTTRADNRLKPLVYRSSPGGFTAQRARDFLSRN